MSRFAAVTAAVCVLATGCGASMTSGAKTATVIGGIAMAGVGMLVMDSGAVDADHNGVNETILDDDAGAVLPGMLMVAGGLAMVLGGLSARTADDDGHVEGPTLAAAHAPIPSVIVTTPSVTVVSPSVAVVADAPVGLPELPADEPTLRIAKQIRVAATMGRCENAWLMWRQLTVQAPEYASAIATGPVLAPCRR